MNKRIYSDMKLSISRSELIKFILVGGVAVMVNILSRYALNRFMIFELAVVLAYIIGMTTAFALTRQFVFVPSGRRAHDEFVRFGIVNVAAAIQVWVISVGLVRLFFPMIGFSWHAEEVGHVIGVTAPVLTSYLGHKHFSFAQRAHDRGA